MPVLFKYTALTDCNNLFVQFSSQLLQHAYQASIMQYACNEKSETLAIIYNIVMMEWHKNFRETEMQPLNTVRCS